MSTSSPPPPPPFGVPPPPVATTSNSRQFKRALRDQRRAAALASRQQRDLYRAQMRANRRNSVLGPLLLVALGVTFLLGEFNVFRVQTALLWLSRWWPIVLVGAGLVLLLEWALDSRTAGQRDAALPRRTLGVSGVLLLLLIVLAGGSATTLARGSAWADENFRAGLLDTWGLDKIFSQKSETTEDLSAPLARGALLTIQNFHGNITVTGTSQDGLVHVSARQRLWAWQSGDLQARQRRDRPTLEASGGGLLLRAAGEGHDETELVIEVPHEAALQIAPERGDLDISELRGGISVEDHQGNIALTALTGNVQLTSHDDNANLTGHSLSGNLTIEGRSGDISFSDVTGPVSLHGDFFGTTHMERIKGPVHFQSSFTDLTCAGVAGAFNVEGRSDLEANDLVGPLYLVTTDRNLTLSGVRDGATIKNRNGSVNLTLADPLAPVQISTTDGTIDVRVPDRAGFRLVADTQDGDIESDLGLAVHKQEEHASVSGQVQAGGPTVHLETTNADIKVHRGSATPNADSSDKGSQSDDE